MGERTVMRRFQYRCLGCVIVFACGMALADQWADVRQVGRFQLRANFALEGHERLIAELEQLDRDLQSNLACRATGEPIHLILFRDQESYAQYLKHYFDGAPTRRALFIKGSMPGWVFAYLNADFEVDLRHETTHAILHSQLPKVPLWLDEGLAEYYEEASDKRIYEHPYLLPTRWEARFYRVASLRQLERLEDVTQMDKADYRAAWSWVHFMLHGPRTARQELVDYLADLRGNDDPGSLSERLYAAIPDLDRQYLKHFRSWHR